ncbi:MAG: helix-turn-helix domain-containing protein [Alistipes sp.]|nr:helix-turn-helix domain-containing protein [Alistipes sp.]
MESAETERLELMRSLRDEGKSYREIGEMMDITKSTVHRLLNS